MFRVRAPSRLHFGLISFAAEEHWPNRAREEVLPARRFGSVGLMVAAPGTELEARPSQEWSAEGPLAERVLAFARRFAEASSPDAVPPLHFVVRRAAPEHAGLGTGTQLGLAVASAVAWGSGLAGPDVLELARRVGRGQRSGVGVHGFGRGGFLVDGGKRAPETIAPLVARAEFPEPWRVVLVVPPGAEGLHGAAEARAFETITSRPPLAVTDSLCRLVLLGMLPALAEGDAAAFGEALYDFNSRVGEVFAPIQGGIYAGPGVAELVAFIRRQGVRGTGQSSWGPTVFAITEDADRARDLARRVADRFALGGGSIVITSASNQGAECGEVAQEDPSCPR